MIEKLKAHIGEVIAGVVILILILLVVFYRPYKLNDVEYEEYNYVVNRTDDEYFTDIVHIGLNRLGIKETAVIIKENTTPIGINSEIAVKAWIDGNGDQFIIRTNIKNKLEAVSVLAHELIHLKQYNDRRLVDGGNVIFWEDSAYFVGRLPFYFDRPWEREAFEQQTDLALYIRDILLTRGTPVRIRSDDLNIRLE